MTSYSSIMIFRNNSHDLIGNLIDLLNDIPEAVIPLRALIDNATVNKYYSNEIVYKWNAIDSTNNTFDRLCKYIRSNTHDLTNVKILTKDNFTHEYVLCFGEFDFGIAAKHLEMFDSNYKNILQK